MSLQILPHARGTQQPASPHDTPGGDAPTRAEIHREALEYAERSIPVFPCRHAPEKSPLTRRGFKDATTDPARVNAYWNQHRGASIGIPTGKGSGIFVVDVDFDPSKGIDGQPHLEELQRRNGKLPDTKTVRTPKGGLHLYFRHVEGITNSPGSLPKGIDVRGEGGYVLAPPSHGYAVEVEAPIASAPAWLLKRIRRRSPDGGAGCGSSSRPEIPEGEPITEGSRNRTLFFRALGLKDAGRNRAEVMDAIRAENRKRCRPALPEDEVGKLIRSAMRYEVRRREADPSAEEIVSKAWERWWEDLVPGGGRSKLRDCARVVLEVAQRYGRSIEAIVGEKVVQAVAFTLSYRQGALPAATSHVTFGKSMAKLVEMGWIVPGDLQPEGDASKWLLLAPATKVYTPGITPEVPGVNPCRAPEKTPILRYKHPVGCTGTGLLSVAERHGFLTPEEYAERVGWSWVRDLERRYLRRLVERGLLAERNGRYGPPEDFAGRAEAERHVPYSSWKRRRTTVDGPRTTRWVEHGPEISDAEREARDRERYEEHRRRFRLMLERRRKGREKKSLLPEGADGFIEDLERVDDDLHPPGCQCLPCAYDFLIAEGVV